MDNKIRYNNERNIRWSLAKKGEPKAIEALAKAISDKDYFVEVSYTRYDSIFFQKYNPKEYEWVKGCSDYYLTFSSDTKGELYSYVEVKIKNTTFDATLNGGYRFNQQISNYGCVSFYLDVEPVYRNMNSFCELNNIDKNTFLIMFINSTYDCIRVISLKEINDLIINGWRGVPISTFTARYGQKSYLIPKDATHDIKDLTEMDIMGYTCNTIAIP
ncbi:hypothetical protein [Clostridium perfringens]|uniref:hypothetical protein n=1 Tax=Clostridium perfringens TaxID=1502 RepID=UPI001C841486|nr:hypothetical protein [Clostridium perfringens]